MHKNAKDLTGMRFGRWTVSEKAPSLGGKTRWRCVCSCGNNKVVISTNLVSGKSSSCGCKRTTHGHSKKPEYLVWYSMVDRCTNRNHKFWSRYGGRGIAVDAVWENSFDAFLLDMGERPSKDHQIDRVNNDKGYTPKNCRWVLSAENVRNRADSKYWYVNGKKYESMRQAAANEGVAHSTIKNWCNNKINGCYSERKYDAK